MFKNSYVILPLEWSFQKKCIPIPKYDFQIELGDDFHD